MYVFIDKGERANSNVFCPWTKQITVTKLTFIHSVKSVGPCLFDFIMKTSATLSRGESYELMFVWRSIVIMNCLR